MCFSLCTLDDPFNDRGKKEQFKTKGPKKKRKTRKPKDNMVHLNGKECRWKERCSWRRKNNIGIK